MLTRTAILFTLIAGLSVPTVADAGVSLQGVSLQGVSLQGVSLQGVSLQGVSLEGVQLRSNDMFNVSVYRTQLRGYRYDDDGILEYRYPNRYRRYVDGTWSSSIYESLAGTYMKGVLSNGETRWMYLYTVRQSDSEDKNTMAKDAHKSNRDVWLYKFLIYTDGGWDWACPGTREGMFLNGTWNQDGTHSTDGITFACNSGVVAKCARGWGYKPWKTISDSAGRSHQLGALHQACVRAAMSDYCGLGEVAESDCLTRNNTAV
ncbi:MAG TPA: ADYC domain-containing protein, partial [Kofleriaceae bacterium]|nr:ADYC domain-containing protein [Kofleriaceae bacterium]